VNDQLVAGRQPIRQDLELFPVGIWRRWVAIVGPTHNALNNKNEEKANLRNSTEIKKNDHPKSEN